MRILRKFDSLPSKGNGPVIALGNFDGVHRGHKEIIALTKKTARAMRAPSAIFTFEPHPRNFFNKYESNFRLSPFRVKFHLLNNLDIDFLYVAQFNQDFANQSPEDFFKNIIIRNIGANHIVAGYDFVFGKDRKGDIKQLKILSEKYGIGLTIVDPLLDPNSTKRFSSESIRGALRLGDIETANHLLGHSWQIMGRVRSGDARGSQLGYPTANLSLQEYLHPLYGVYAVQVKIEDISELYQGVANIGIRPMFGINKPIIETHIFGFSRNIYGKYITISLVSYLRPEQDFGSLEGLRIAMDKDSLRAKKLLDSIKVS